MCVFVYMCMSAFKTQTHPQLFVTDKNLLSLLKLVVHLKYKSHIYSSVIQFNWNCTGNRIQLLRTACMSESQAS